MKTYLKLAPLCSLLASLIFLQGCQWNDFSVVTWEKYDEVIPPEPGDKAIAWAAQPSGVISAFPWTVLMQFGTDMLRFRSKYIGESIENRVGLKSYSVIRLLGGRRKKEVWPEAIKVR